MESLHQLLSLKEGYLNHYLQLIKVKAIFKEELKFKASITKSMHHVVECISRNEAVRTNEECLLLKIDCFVFRKLVLPLIREDLEVKLFCLKNLPFFSVNYSQLEFHG